MRIIGGSLKGRTFNPPAGYQARPTTDFAKEGLFNALTGAWDFPEISVLDLFGGTGSISFEFASRGCPDIVTVEMNPANAAFIKKTAAGFGLLRSEGHPQEGCIRVVHHNVFDFLGICNRTFDLIFADPPYALEGLEGLPGKILGAGILHPEGRLILEHPSTCHFENHPGFLRERRYGNVHFSWFAAQ